MKLMFDCSAWVLRSRPEKNVNGFDRTEFSSAGRGRHYSEVWKPRKAIAAASALRVIGYVSERVVMQRGPRSLSPDVLAWDVCFRLNQALEIMRPKTRTRRAA